MKVGDLIYPWADHHSVGLIVGYVSDQWSERFMVLSDGRVCSTTILRNYESTIVMPKRIPDESR